MHHGTHIYFRNNGDGNEREISSARHAKCHEEASTDSLNVVTRETLARAIVNLSLSLSLSLSLFFFRFTIHIGVLRFVRVCGSSLASIRENRALYRKSRYKLDVEFVSVFVIEYKPPPIIVQLSR
jgi:hypothetical protein